jgi:predicted patatin/cPLA2 family phospholipase
MHLTQKQVKKILPFIKHFVRTGDLLKDEVLVNVTAEDNLPQDTATALVSTIKLAKKYLREERSREE